EPSARPPLVGKKRRRKLRTGRHVDAEQTNWFEREDQHEDGEDQRLTPLATGEIPTEHVDDSDEEATDPGADDIADPAQHGCGERDDTQAEPEVPLDVTVVDAVDDRPRRGQRRADEEGDRDGAVDVDPAEQRGG